MNPAPLLRRLTHQFAHECRHHWPVIVGWIAWLLLRHATLAADSSQDAPLLSAIDISLHVEIATLLCAALLAWRCVRADSPSNTDTSTLTRPIGHGVLWVAKLAFLAIAVIAPVLIIEARQWRGFGLDAAQWLALAGGWLLFIGIVCGIAGTLTSLASSTRQFIALAVVGLLAAFLYPMLVYHGVVSLGPPGVAAAARATRTSGSIAGGALSFTVIIAAWWLVSVPRRRLAAVVTLCTGLIAGSLLARIEWPGPDSPRYPVKKIGIKTGKADPADKAPGRGLWPTLRITGLGKDEVPSIVEFAPITDAGAWPPLGSYSDVAVNARGWDAWLHPDHVRALLKHSPPATLWDDHLMNDALYDGRKPVRECIKPLRLDPKAPPTRWRLRLAVHEMKPLATLPFKQLWTQSNTVLVRPGMRIEFDPFIRQTEAWELHGRLHTLHSAVRSTETHAPTQARGRSIARSFLLVLEDPERRENVAHDLGFTQWRVGVPLLADQAWQDELTQSFQIRLWDPAAQRFLLHTTVEDWKNRLNATLWVAEDRGTADLELSAEQMKEVLYVEPPKTPAAK